MKVCDSSSLYDAEPFCKRPCAMKVCDSSILSDAYKCHSHMFPGSKIECQPQAVLQYAS